MRLSEKIMDLRKKSGWSQEELAERLGISRQSVSKWETGESVPDIDKIIRMSELWNVSTDYLLKDDPENGEQAKEHVESSREDDDRTENTYRESAGGFARRVYEEQKSKRRQVTGWETEEWLKMSGAAAPRIATGVLLCILSPICLLILGVLSEKSGPFGNAALIPENVAGGIGLVVLLVLIAIAIAIIVTTGMRMSKYE